jgi:D-glycero-D-manno-heptose 1,7-bisphosphate phosphatase
MASKFKVIILDRDGVINEDSKEFIKSPEEWKAISGSLEAIAKLNKANIKVVVASNQSGVARGYFSLDTLAKIHEKMQRELAKVGGHLDGIFFCPHGPDSNCSCRKPKPSLLLDIAKSFNVDPEEMLAIGDSLRDVLAAKAAGCPVWIVKTGNGIYTLSLAEQELDGIPVFADLESAVDELLKK